jgi:hypothetical protein
MQHELNWLHELAQSSNFNIKGSLIYCVHPIDTPFQDWNLEIVCKDFQSPNGMIGESCVPFISKAYIESIKRMAIASRNAILRGYVDVKFVTYKDITHMFASLQEHNSRNSTKPVIIGDIENGYATSRNNMRFDIVMTGNGGDVYSLYKTLYQSKHFLKFPWNNPDAYILTHHRSWKLEPNNVNEEHVLHTDQDIAFPVTNESSKERYELVPCIENQRGNSITDLFQMKDYWLKNVKWKWQLINNTAQRNVIFPFGKNNTDTNSSYINEKEIFVRVTPQTSGTVNFKSENTGINLKTKTASSVPDNIENAKYNTHSMQKKKEPSGMERKFSSLQNQAGDKQITASNDTYFSSRLLYALPF